jgi:uncharacterized membrane protein YeaQ/YmgE (transglycosylase-associated protein family)
MIAVRLGERPDEVVDVLAGDEPRLGMLVDEPADPLGRPVVDRDRVAVPAGEVARQVGAHHRQPHHADVRLAFIAHAGLLTVSCLGTPARGKGVRMIGAIILGLLAGFIGKALMPGRDPGGFFVTILLGLAGSVVGFLIFTELLGIGDNDVFDLGGLIGAIIGVMILLGIYRAVVARRGGVSRGRV